MGERRASSTTSQISVPEGALDLEVSETKGSEDMIRQVTKRKEDRFGFDGRERDLPFRGKAREGIEGGLEMDGTIVSGCRCPGKYVICK